MTTNSTIDFSAYSDEQLESSLSSINRDKFEQNYLVCLAEIEKRKADGRWQINRTERDPQSILKIHKWVRIFALVQVIGGVLGIGNYLFTYGPQIISGQVAVINLFLLMIILLMFAATVWAGWIYWKTEQDKNGLWRLLLGLQIPAFNIAGFGYEFYSGFTVPLGLADERFGISVNLASNIALLWNPQNTNFHLTANLSAIVILALLSQTISESSKVAVPTI